MGLQAPCLPGVSGPADSGDLPYDVLATVNEYGSPEQANDALLWLKSLALSQGASEVDPPRVGDASVALTLDYLGR